MTTHNKFTEIMQQRSDAELLEIVTKLRDDYESDAVAAAETELKKRELTPDKLDQAEKEVEQKHKVIEETANQPLDIHWIVLCLLFPGLINFFLAFIFKGQGQDRKFKEAWRWTFYGFGFYISILIIALIVFSILPTDESNSQDYCDCNDILQDTIANIWYFENLPYSGECMSYFESGLKEYESAFINGKMHGLNIMYYKNGNVMEIVEWKQGQPDGDVIYLSENGDTSECGMVVKGTKTGRWKYFYESGKLKGIENLINNVLEDSSIGYFENGNIEMRGFWINGKANGLWTFYDSITGNIDGYLRYENDSIIEYIDNNNKEKNNNEKI